MNIKQALIDAVEKLKQNNIQEPIIKSRILLANMLNMRKEDLIINEDKELQENEIREFRHNIDKLSNNYPLQYITGKQEFMGKIFEVNENVLIPRQDTEILVEEAIKYAKNDVLELCTGSGIIAISIAEKCRRFFGIILPKKALQITFSNKKEVIYGSKKEDLGRGLFREKRAEIHQLWGNVRKHAQRQGAYRRAGAKGSRKAGKGVEAGDGNAVGELAGLLLGQAAGAYRRV